MSTPPRYGFYGRLKKEFPSQIIVDATEVCNLACVHCPHPEFKKSEHYKARYLTLELHHKMVQEVKQFGKGFTQYIRYTSNGEPLVHPKIFEMLEYAAKESGVYVTLTTNGTLLKEDKINKLLATGIRLVDISIDAFQDTTYADIRRNGKLETTRKNVINLIKANKEKNSPLKVIVSFVEQPNNKDEVTEFEKFWKEQGADYVVIRRLHSAAGEVQTIAKQLQSDTKSIPRKPCLYPWERILLNPKGELAFCPQDWSHGSALVSYENTTIRETWNGEMYLKLREAHLKNQFENHAFCGKCPDWSATRWPDEGRSYANMVEEFQSSNII